MAGCLGWLADKMDVALSSEFQEPSSICLVQIFDVARLGRRSSGGFPRPDLGLMSQRPFGLWCAE